MIAVDKLGLKQGEFSLHDLNFEIPEGKYGVLVGKSGCGKTTLLEAVCGLRPINAGRILLGGQEVTSCKPGERGVGYVPQDGALFPHLSVAKQLAFSLVLRKTEPSQISRRVEKLADRLGISHLLDRMPDALSGGECQRVALARAMVSEPSLILADEPSGNLDHKTGREIMNLLFKLCRERGQSLILVTHNRELAKQSDRTLILSEGRLKKTQPDEQA